MLVGRGKGWSEEKWAVPTRTSAEDTVDPGRAVTWREGPAGHGGVLSREGDCRK